jgi:hypothetical protein
VDKSESSVDMAKTVILLIMKKLILIIFLIMPICEAATTIRDSCKYDGDDCDSTNEGFESQATYCEMGYYSSVNHNTSFRFDNVTVPQGATIDSAVIQWYCESGSSDNIDMDIYAKDADNNDSLIQASDFADGGTFTTAKVDWLFTTNTSDYNWYEITDVRTIVKEIVDRTGWISGNSIVFMVMNRGNGDALQYCGTQDGGLNKSAKLIVIYSTSAFGVDDYSLTILGTTTVLEETEMRQSAATTNYGTATSNSFGKNATDSTISSMILKWKTLSDSLALAPGGDSTYPWSELDSILMLLCPASPVASAESLSAGVYTSRRGTWDEVPTGEGNGCTWTNVNEFTNWTTTGARNTSTDRYDDAPKTTKLRYANTDDPNTDIDTFYISKTNFGKTNESVILSYTAQWGTSPIMAFYTSEIDYAAYQPTLKLYFSPKSASTLVSYAHGPSGNAPAHSPDGNRQAHK